MEPDPKQLIALANYRMPFGRYKGRHLIDLPEAYVCWFARKGFPTGRLGDMLRMVHEIKINGLEELVRPFQARECPARPAAGADEGGSEIEG
ncbi:MAG: DUF3820 family protein [Kiritimatiellae bacterium]|nr:DUF3820 family protein [Kiritimatiellia bacterium]